MAYSNSSLVSKTILSPMCDDRGGRKILKITPHHAAAVGATLEGMGNVFRTREASANYGIDVNGNIALYVEEKNRAWTSSNATNDFQAVTIEIANSGAGPDWKISDKSFEALVKLCVDICKRNGIAKLNYTGDATGNLTRHNMFVATACPGPYLQSKFPELANRVNAQLSSGSKPTPIPDTKVIYRVQVGAYSMKANAEAMKAKLEKDGYSTIMVRDNGLYKVQVGAYTVEANALKMEAKLKSAGYPTYITSKTGTAVVSEIKVGSKVKIKNGARAYDNTVLAPFVYDRVNTVTQITGDRVVVSYGGVIVAAVRKDDLELI